MTASVTTRFGITALGALVFACAAPPAPPEPVVDVATESSAVSAVLDAFHHNASVPDEAAYFGLFAPDAVFIGTDATERWPVEEFRTYAHGRFEQGTGWTYRLREGTRNIDISPRGDVAWFDELLDNERYGLTRGTGVLRSIDGQWKIAQYHLTIPVPNDLAVTVVDMIRNPRTN